MNSQIAPDGGLVKAIQNAANSKVVLLAAKISVAGLLCYFTGAFAYITLARINYPFVLEWLEGASLIQVNRILSGQLLYVKPSLEYVALIYSPLYFYVAAMLAKVIGFGFLPLRLVSLFSTFGCLALIYLWVHKHTGNRYAAFMAAGTFLAIYKIGGAWYDIARVDMLALFLMLLAIHLAEDARTVQLALAGAAISLACLTKQTYLIMVLPLFIYTVSLHRARALIMVAATLLVSGASSLWLNWVHQGWYAFFVYTLSFGQRSNVMDASLSHLFLGYWKTPVLKSVPVLFLFFAAYFVRKTRAYGKRLGVLALAAGMVLISWSGILNKGGYNNVLIPSYTIFLMFAWLLISEVLASSALPNAFRSAVLLMYCAQLLLLLYPIAAQIPTTKDLKAGQALVQEIGQTSGDVYMPYDNYLALYTHKRAFANFSAMDELRGGGAPEAIRAWAVVNAQLSAAIQSQQFDLIVLDQPTYSKVLDRFYESSLLQTTREAFMPVTGWQWRPALRYTPRSAQ